MGVISTRTQPQGIALIDWSNPITKNLVHAAVPSAAESFGGGNIVLSSGVGVKAGRAGMAWVFDGSESGPAGVFPGVADVLAGATSATSLILATFPAFPSTSKAVARRLNQFSWQMATNGRLILFNRTPPSSSSNIDAWQPSAITVLGGPPSLFGMTFVSPGGTSSSYNGVVNGVLVPATSNIYVTYTPTSVAADSDDPYALGSDGGFAKTIYMSLMWRRALSALEIASLNANPWQLFLPPRRFRLASYTYKRGLYLSSGTIGQISNGQLSSVKPLIWDGLKIKERSTNEGTPIIIENGVLRLLKSNEILIN